MSVDKYPKVHGEWATITKLKQGFSIARFGDGELKMATGKEYVREPVNRRMARELCGILQRPHPKCLVGIWPLDPKSPKHASLVRHRERFKTVLSSKVEYYSSLISRPDSAPWIRTREYAEAFQSLWNAKRVTLLCEKSSSALRALDLTKSPDHTVSGLPIGLEHIECPSYGAYARIDEFETIIAYTKPDIAILSCGPTATCLANRLSKHGIQAIDFGSGGSFIAKLLSEGACADE